MNAVIYARYSSDNQREESIEGQLRECMEFAKESGITVIDTYIDRALTAKTDNRPSFQKMIKDSYRHCFDAIIVWKLDRFSRNRYDSAHYKAMLKKNGVKVISAKESIADGSEGILLESVLEGMAEYYSAELSEKVIRGMTENTLKGLFNGGQLTFGYRIDENRHYAIDEATAPIVVEVFKMYDAGNTIVKITDYLNSKNVKTYRGGKMTTVIVQRMLSNRKYIGEYKFRDTIIPNCIPPIVPEDLFNRIQKRLAGNKPAPAHFKAKEEYFLSLKLYCGKCGAHMVGESGRGTSQVYRYYKCLHAKKYKSCDKKAIKKEWIEDLAVQYALEILYDDKILDYLTDRIFALQDEENPLIPRLKQQLADVEKRIDNLMNAIEQGIILETTKGRLTALEKQKNDLEIAILQETIKKPYLTKEQIRFGIEKFKTLDPSTVDGKRELIDCFINSIYVYDDKLVLTFNYKDGTRTVLMSELENTPKSSDIKMSRAPKSYTEYFGIGFFFSAPRRSKASPTGMR